MNVIRSATSYLTIIFILIILNGCSNTNKENLAAKNNQQKNETSHKNPQSPDNKKDSTDKDGSSSSDKGFSESSSKKIGSEKDETINEDASPRDKGISGIWRSNSGALIKITTNGKNIWVSSLDSDEKILMTYHGKWDDHQDKMFIYYPGNPNKVTCQLLPEKEIIARSFDKDENPLKEFRWEKIKDLPVKALKKKHQDPNPSNLSEKSSEKELSTKDKEKSASEKALKDVSPPEKRPEEEIEELKLAHEMLVRLGKDIPLKELNRLEFLNLSRTNIQNRDLKRLLALNNLKEIDLSHCAHLDGTMPRYFTQFKELKQLRLLNLTGIKGIISKENGQLIQELQDFQQVKKGIIIRYR